MKIFARHFGKTDTFQSRCFRKACYPGGSQVCCSSWVTPRVPVALFTTSCCPLQSCRRAELSRAWSAGNVVFSLAASLFTEEIPPHNEEMLEINQPRGHWRANCWTVELVGGATIRKRVIPLFWWDWAPSIIYLYNLVVDEFLDRKPKQCSCIRY